MTATPPPTTTSGSSWTTATRTGRRPQPVAAPCQMAAGDPALHRAVLPGHRGALRGDRDLVRYLVHRPLPAQHIHLRRRRLPLAQPRRRLRVHPGHRSVPALQTGTMTQAGPATPPAPAAFRDRVRRTAVTGMPAPPSP